MTSEEMERAIEFVMKQQAQFTTDLQKVTQAFGESEKTLRTVVGLLGQVAETQLQLTEAQTDLVKAQARTDEALAETNERLNSLIVVVERYFSNGRDAGR
jgi:ABC-type transporter Mla subunit MlaD